MERNRKILIAGVATVLVAGGATAAIAGNPLDDFDEPITGDALTEATDAALAHTGEGRVSGTEVGDEESYYEVEVTLDNGSEVDVQLDEQFQVVGTEDDGAPGSTDD